MDEFVSQAKKWNIELSHEQIEKFSSLLSELKAWNEHTNLTAIREDKDILQKHFLDSLTLLQVIPKDTETLIDVGTGAGFPGLPLSIVRPEIQVTLLESVHKKVMFLEHSIQKLNLSKTRALYGRAEEIGQNVDYREEYDIAVARAVAELRVLTEYCLPLVRVGGLFIAQKNAGGAEISQAEHAISILGGKLETIIPVQIGNENRQLIVIKKIASTPKAYPRRAGTPAKKPL